MLTTWRDLSSSLSRVLIEEIILMKTDPNKDLLARVICVLGGMLLEWYSIGPLFAEQDISIGRLIIWRDKIYTPKYGSKANF